MTAGTTTRPAGPSDRTRLMILNMHVHPHDLLQFHSHSHPHVLWITIGRGTWWAGYVKGGAGGSNAECRRGARMDCPQPWATDTGSCMVSSTGELPLGAATAPFGIGACRGYHHINLIIPAR